MKLSAILEPLVAAGVDPATILATVRAWEEQQVDALERRRANDRERQERRRHVTSRDVTVTVSSRGGAARVEDKSQTTEIEPHQEENKKRERALASFAEFWSAYPNKTGKPVAQKSYLKAIRSTEPAVILDGLRRYIASKPPDRPWLNPSTFLNQERWADQPANVVPMARGSPRPVETLIDSLLAKMDDADANATTQTEGHQAAARRLSSH